MFTHSARVVLVVLVGVGLIWGSAAAQAQTAEEIVSSSIAASGGEEAIARIRNFTSSGRVSVESPFFGKLEGTFEAVRVPGRGYFESATVGAISQQRGWDGKRSWERGPNGLRTLEGDEAAMLATQSFANMFVGRRQLTPGTRIERLDDAEVNGRPHYVLSVSGGGAARSTVYVDRETRLLTRSTATLAVPALGEATLVIDVGGYETFEGVKMPTAVTVTVQDISTTRVTLERTVVNTAVDLSIFTAP